MRQPRGFTLIELMIVVAIVAILALIAYPSYQEYIRKTHRAQAKADLMELVQQLERRYTTDRTYAGFDLPAESPRDADAGAGFYALTPATITSANTYTLTATPENSQTSDRCGTLTIDNFGVKTHSAGPDDCW
ncbi:MAG TPA: type IV pilin protein [Rhodanobacteraceae bacterium]|nr:type IV pilin protein [Rhodanobacteraceae bacterium]